MQTVWIRRLLLFFVGATILIEDLGAAQIGGYPIGPAKVSTALLLMYAVGAWLLTGVKLPWNRKHVWVLLFATSLLIANILAAAKGANPAGQVALWTSYAAVLLFYYLVPWTVRSRRDLDILMAGLVVGAYVAVSSGLLAPSRMEAAAGRFLGTASNPNDQAYGLTLLLPITLALFPSTHSLLGRTFLLGGLVVSATGIILSLSRSAFVAVASMGSLYSVRFGSREGAKHLIPVLMLGALVILLAPQAFYDRLDTFLTEEGRAQSGPIQSRLRQYDLGLQAFGSHPILGVGDRQFSSYARSQGANVAPGEVIHNTYIGVAAEQGLIGLIPFVMVVVLTWLDYSRLQRWSQAKSLKNDPDVAVLRHRATLFQIAFFGCIVGQQFSPYLRAKEFWLLIGLSSALVALFRMQVEACHPQLLQRSAGPQAAAQIKGDQSAGKEGRV